MTALREEVPAPTARDDLRAIAERADRALGEVHASFERSKVVRRSLQVLEREGPRVSAGNLATGQLGGRAERLAADQLLGPRERSSKTARLYSSFVDDGGWFSAADRAVTAW